VRIDTLTYNNIHTQGAKRRLWLREHSPEHLLQCKNIMLRALQIRPQSVSTSTIVLGAGACTEVPLAEIARHSDEVVLADYDLASMQQGRDEMASTALHKRVRLLKCDITGGASVHLNRLVERLRWDKLQEQSARIVFDAVADCLEQCEIPDPPEIENVYSGEFGAVISSLVLSQLFSYPLLDVLDAIQHHVPSYIGEQERHHRYQEAAQSFRVRIIQGHLHLLHTLLDEGGIVVLLTDVRGFVFKISDTEHISQPLQALPIVPRTFPDLVRENFHVIEEHQWEWIADLPEGDKLGRGYEVVGYIIGSNKMPNLKSMLLE
jgi:hypothetical protein